MWRTLKDNLGKIRPAWVLLGVIGLATALRLWRLDVLPPGLFFDEAYNGFDARQILQGDHFPLFFPANNGREPLFIYLQAVSVAVLGATPYALRVVSALVGIVTIPILYFCAHTLLRPMPSTPEQQRTAGWLALVAAAGAAVSYWHLSLSRLGFRANLLIPLSALAIAFFWRGWTGQRLRDYAWAGLWLALALYTYIAARFLPLVILAFVVVELIISLWRQRAVRPRPWQQGKPRLLGLLVLAGVTVLVASPLAWSLLHNPALLSARTGQVSLWATWPADQPFQWLSSLFANGVAVLRAFYDQGDPNLRHNLPGRPANDLLLALLFTLGWVSALLTAAKRPRSRLLLLWFAVMLLPTVLSTGAPHYLRSAGALPPLAMFYAVGVEATDGLWRRASARRAAASPSAQLSVPLVLAVVLLMLAFSGGATTVDYFQRWARLPGLGSAFDVDRQLAAATAARLLENPTAQDTLLMPADLYLQPQMGFALGPVAASDRLPPLQPRSAGIQMLQKDNFDPRASLMLVSLQDGQAVSTWLQALPAQDQQAATPGDVLRWPTHQPGWPQLTEVMLPAGAPLSLRQIRYPLNVAFANGLRLVGYDVEPDVLQPGQTDAARLTLFWQDDAWDESGSQQAEGRGDFDVFAHLSVAGAVVATANGQLGGQDLAARLHAGQPIIEDVRMLAVPGQAEPGKAHFEVGLYRYRSGADQGANERIAIVDPTGQAVADRLDLGAVWIGAPTPTANLTDLSTVGVLFDNRIELSGAAASLDPNDPQPQRLLVELGWRAVDRSTVDYQAFVHLLDSAGQIVSQQDAPPGGTTNPTSLWAPGETVRSTFALEIPDGLSEDGLTLRIGLYEPVGGRQLPVSSVDDTTADISGGTYVLIPLPLSDRLIKS